jgi:hypothetical protein
MSEQRQVVVCIPGSVYGFTDKVSVLIVLLANLAAAATSTLADCIAVDLSAGPRTLHLTAWMTFNGAAVAGARIHVLTSINDVDIDFDTVDWDSWDVQFTAGATVQQSKNYDTCPAFIKVLVENLDVAQAITDIYIIATIGP